MEKKKRTPQDYYDDMVLMSGMIKRLQSNAKEIKRELSKIEESSVTGISSIFLGQSNVMYDWVTRYNRLVYGNPLEEQAKGKLSQTLVEEAQGLDVEENLDVIRKIYKSAQTGNKSQLNKLSRVELMSETIKAAQKFVRKRPNGPKQGEGKTIAALCVLATGKIYASTSGNPNKIKWANQTSQVVSGVQQIEKWPVKACAEVHALDLAIKDGNPIQPGSKRLYSYCYTWYGKWLGRRACKNCWQWIQKYK